MRYPQRPVLVCVTGMAILLMLPARVAAWSGFFNHPNAGWYLFRGPIVLPRFGIAPTYALDHLEYQRLGVGYGGFAGSYPTMALGYGPYPNWGPGTRVGGIPFGRRPSALPVDTGPELQAPHARFRIAVPADAQVWLEGASTQQSGTLRHFVSPPLEPGASYGYTIRARWRERGQVVEQTKEIEVQAGDQVNVTFPLPN